LRAPAIILSDHRAVYDAKCGSPQMERRGLLKCGHLRTGRRIGKGFFFADVLYGLLINIIDIHIYQYIDIYRCIDIHIGVLIYIYMLLIYIIDIHY